MAQLISSFERSGFSLDDKYALEGDQVLLTGVQALVRVLLDQRRADDRRGLNTAGFVSGYPGSPLGGVDLELQRQRAILEANHVVHIPGLNEDLAATAVLGTQTVPGLPGARYDGVFGMWFGKAPGVDRTGDAFRHGNYRGVSEHGGILAVAGDDPDAVSTIVPSDSNVSFYDWWMPTLFPGDVQDVVDLGLHGYALSRASGLWTGFKIVTNVADGSGTALVGHDRISPMVPELSFDGQPFKPSFRMNTAGRGMLEVEHELYYGRLAMAREYGRENGLNRVVVNPGRARLGIVAPGRTYFDVRHALNTLGLDDETLYRNGIRLMKVGMLFPLHERDIHDFADGLDEVIVVEDKRSYLEMFFKDLLYHSSNAPKVLGKRDDVGADFLPAGGELTADIIARVIGPRIRRIAPLESIDAGLAHVNHPVRSLIPLSVERSAYFCSGCPHNRSLVVPDGSVVGVGIGCHIMALGAQREDFGELAGYTHMGAEGAQWIGAAPFTDTKHIFQNLGDGTFFHSGSLAVRWAVASKVNITYKLLYNGAVGMTGGQAVEGAMPIPELTRMLEAEGVRRIIITTDDTKKYRGVRLAKLSKVWHRDRLLEAQETLSQTAGVSVLIHDQHCAAEKRRLRKRGKMVQPTVRAFVNERVCEACGDCGKKSNCLSVQSTETEFGPKTVIHQSSCNLDYSCVLGDCPSFLTIDTRKAHQAKRTSKSSPPDVPSPHGHLVDPDSFNIVMTGIGGTGVVTVSQVLATAATIEGKSVRNLDETGSSQKAGPVVSQLQIFSDQRDASSTIGAGEADLLLAFDLLTAMSPRRMEKFADRRTVVVASTSKVPTGRMSADNSLTFPSVEAMRSDLDRTTRAQHGVYLDALSLAEGLFGDHVFANMLLVGAAHQVGALPLSTASIEEAIRVNGAAVDVNLAAFHWGRVAVADPASALANLPAKTGSEAQHALGPSVAERMVAALGVPAELERVLGVRTADLIAYQDAGYARRYLDVMSAVVTREQQVSPGEIALSLAAARSLHKLMAYKDEYEVARLHLEEAASAAIREEFGEGAKVYWNLHPPMLRAIGVDRKLKLGPWFKPVLQLLAKMRTFRGRAFDPFGRAVVRRVERELVEHYCELLRELLPRLDASNLSRAIDLVGMPDMVRGYEDIKLDNVRVYVHEMNRATADLDMSIPLGPALQGVLDRDLQEPRA